MDVDKKIENIIKEIKNLSVGDFVKLNDALKEEFKITPEMLSMGGGQASSADASAGSAANEVEDANKKVAVYLKGLGAASAIQYIKAMREAVGCSIDVAKTHTTKVAAGEIVVINEGISRKDAEEFVAKLNTVAAGLVLEIK